MRIAADYRHAGQGQPLFRPDHMDNPLPLVEAIKQTHPELGTIPFQRFHLRTGDRVGNAAFRVQRRHIMIRHRLNRRGTPRRALCFAQTVERLRRGHLVHQMPVDIQQHLPCVLTHHMCLPNLVV